MAKRFGRNQKRKMKARIAKLEAECAQSKILLVSAYKQIKDLTYQLETIIEELQKINRYCALLPPETIKTGHKENDRFEIWIPPSEEEILQASPNDLINNSMVIPFLEVFLNIRQNVITLQRLVHLKVRYDRNSMAYYYAVSPEALKLYPESVAEEVQYELKKLLPIAIQKLINGGKYALV